MHEEEIGKIVIDTSIQLHREIGPGLLESVYESVLKKQLEKRGLSVERQVPVRIEYDGEIFEEGFRADLVVESKVILEMKSIEKLNNAHKNNFLLISNLPT